MVGTHWTPTLLAGILAAQECGIPLGEAAAAASSFQAFPARMQPVELPSGAIVIRDEYNGSPDSFETALRAFKSARAKRKILIAGDYSDSSTKRRRRLTRLGRTAADLSDFAIFIGEHSHYSRDGAIQAGLAPERTHSFPHLRNAVPVLKKELRRGDLVLLKSRSNDHFSRLLFAQVGEVSCWLPSCPKRFLCDICWQLGCDESDMKKIREI
jgi:UDP-N-acetylmuramoyl-tripeptide--D-alanyl-D-alanine ligase